MGGGLSVVLVDVWNGEFSFFLQVIERSWLWRGCVERVELAWHVARIREPTWIDQVGKCRRGTIGDVIPDKERGRANGTDLSVQRVIRTLVPLLQLQEPPCTIVIPPARQYGLTTPNGDIPTDRIDNPRPPPRPSISRIPLGDLPLHPYPWLRQALLPRPARVVVSPDLRHQ